MTTFDWTETTLRFAVVNAHVVPVVGSPFDGAVLVEDGRIAGLGPDVDLTGVPVVNAGGAWLLPGLIDAHTHLGAHMQGYGPEDHDINEESVLNAAAMRALDTINPADTGFQDALSGGVTTVNVTPGSHNPIGGVGTALHTAGRLVEQMVLRQPSGLKMAVGENPKRQHAARYTLRSRMGIANVVRSSYVKAQEYMAAKAAGANPARDLALENLELVLTKQLRVRNHAHRIDDIMSAVRWSEEFGYDLAIDHGTEAHLVADELAARGIPVAVGPILGARSKIELANRSTEGPALLAKAGVEISIITDHPVLPIQHLVLQTIVAIRDGLDRDTALRAITINPARLLGLDGRIGSIEVGKSADLVLWEGDPFDIMNRVQRVWVDGRSAWTRARPLAFSPEIS